MAVDEHLHRFTNEEYLAMAEAGVFEDARVELLDGLVVDMTPQGPEHADLIRVFTMWFGARLDLLAIQLTLPAMDGWVPEPDVALNDRPPRGEHPTTAAICVEVAVSSQRRDRRKARAYAAADVDRYWIVDLPARRIIEHAEPGPAGYGVVRVLTGDDVLDPRVEGIAPRTVEDLLDA